MPAIKALDRYQKIAILILALGEQEGAQILANLGEQEVIRVVAVLKNMAAVSKEQADEVLKEFKSIILNKSSASPQNFAENMLKKRFGAQEGLQDYNEIFLPAIQGVSGQLLARVTLAEKPQVLAVIASCCEDKQGAEFIKSISEKLRTEIIIKMAKLKAPDMEALAELNQQLEKLINKEQISPSRHLGGTEKAAKLLAALGNDTMAQNILNEITMRDTNLANKIKDQMFTFDDLSRLEAASVMVLFLKTQNLWPLALIEASPTLTQHILQGISQGARKNLQEEIADRPKKRRSEVEEARRKILEIAKELIKEGKITVKNDEEYV